MRALVLSIQNEQGRERLQSLDVSVKWMVSPGVLSEDVPEHIREHWNPGRFSRARNERLMGAFAAHLQAWEMLAGSDSPPCLILEDDARQLRPLPRLGSHLTLLGGVFAGFGGWDDFPRWVSSGDFALELFQFKDGVRRLPERAGRKMKWYNAVAYYLPRGAAEKLVHEVYATRTRTLRSPDIWLNAHATHFAWPPPFASSEAKSQCLAPSGNAGGDLYCNRRMLHHLEKLRRGRAARCDVDMRGGDMRAVAVP